MDTNIWSAIISAASGLTGAVIGGWATLKATKASNAHQLKLQQQEQKQRIDGVLRAIHCELEVLMKFYASEAGKVLDSLKSGNPYTAYFVLTEKYFIVYPTNTALVAQIDDPDLSRSIIVTYNKANFLIEMFRINNRYIEWRNECIKLSRDGTESKYIVMGNEILGLQVAHAASLKKADADLKSTTEELLAKISAYLARKNK